jgi:hypothetical protein
LFLTLAGYYEKSENTIALATANGDIVVDRQVNLPVSKLQSQIKPLLLNETPPVLSVGRRCMEEGYDFIWRRGKSPYFITPDKRMIRLTVENYTPWLVEREDSFACPAGVVPVQAGSSEQPSVEVEEVTLLLKQRRLSGRLLMNFGLKPTPSST